MSSSILRNLLFVGVVMTSSLIHSEAQAAKIQKIKPSWEEIHAITRDVCDGIDRDSFDVICGISVGGLVPTALFSLELDEKNVTAISSKSYQGQTQGELVIGNGPELSVIRGKRVLLVDDIVDSGTTINRVREHLLEHYGAKSVEVVALYLNTEHHSGDTIGIWGRETTQWVEFPWEIKFGEGD